MNGTLSTSKARTNAPLRARKGKLAGLLAIGLSLCCLASPLKTVDSAKASSTRLKTIDYQIHALNKLRDLKQFNCLLTLYAKESAWDPTAHNGTHYGIPQGDSTWLRNKSGIVQVDWGLKYIRHRYGTACKALKHWSRYGWH